MTLMPISDVEMRATRAYVAGFGTAGSLVAGVAILFVVASAIVSFQGLPPIALPGTSATLSSGGTPSGARTPTSQRLLAAARAAAARASSTAGTARSTVTNGLQPSAGRALQTQPATSSVVPSASAQTPGGRPTAGPKGSPLGTVVPGTTSQLGNTVTSTGQSLGTAVTNASGGVSKTLAPVSSSLSGTVQQLGGTVSGAPGAAGGTAGSALTGVGRLLGGGK